MLAVEPTSSFGLSPKSWWRSHESSERIRELEKEVATLRSELLATRQLSTRQWLALEKEEDDDPAASADAKRTALILDLQSQLTMSRKQLQHAVEAAAVAAASAAEEREKRVRTEAAAAAASEAAADLMSTFRSASAERERALNDVDRAKMEARRIADAARVEINLIKRAAAEERAEALEQAAAKSLQEMEKLKQRAMAEKTQALEEASAELMCAIGVLMDEASRKSTHMTVHGVAHGAIPSPAPAPSLGLPEKALQNLPLAQGRDLDESSFTLEHQSAHGRAVQGPASEQSDDDHALNPDIGPTDSPKSGSSPVLSPSSAALHHHAQARLQRARSEKFMRESAQKVVNDLEADARTELKKLELRCLKAEEAQMEAEAKMERLSRQLSETELERNEAVSRGSTMDNELAAMRDKLQRSEESNGRLQTQLARLKKQPSATGEALFAKQMQKRLSAECFEAAGLETAAIKKIVALEIAELEDELVAERAKPSASAKELSAELDAMKSDFKQNHLVQNSRQKNGTDTTSILDSGRSDAGTQDWRQLQLRCVPVSEILQEDLLKEDAHVSADGHPFTHVEQEIMRLQSSGSLRRISTGSTDASPSHDQSVLKPLADASEYNADQVSSSERCEVSELPRQTSRSNTFGRMTSWRRGKKRNTRSRWKQLFSLHRASRLKNFPAT